MDEEEKRIESERKQRITEALTYIEVNLKSTGLSEKDMAEVRDLTKEIRAFLAGQPLSPTMPVPPVSHIYERIVAGNVPLIDCVFALMSPTPDAWVRANYPTVLLNALRTSIRLYSPPGPKPAPKKIPSSSPTEMARPGNYVKPVDPDLEKKKKAQLDAWAKKRETLRREGKVVK